MEGCQHKANIPLRKGIPSLLFVQPNKFIQTKINIYGSKKTNLNVLRIIMRMRMRMKMIWNILD